MTAPADRPSSPAGNRPSRRRSVVVEVDELPDAFGSPVRCGDTVTSAELDPSLSPLLVAATVVGLRRIEGRPQLVLDPVAVTAPLHGGVPARPGRVLRRRPASVVRHRRGPASEPGATGAAVVDAHGRDLVAGQRVAALFQGAYGLPCWARATVTEVRAEVVVVVPDAVWMLTGHGQRVLPTVAYPWTPRCVVILDEPGSTGAGTREEH